MSRSRTSSAWFVLWLGLLFLSFRPVGAIERAGEIALAPLRYAVELVRPLGVLRARRVRAAERSLAGSARAEAAEGADLLARLAVRALPQDSELRKGRRFIPAEVCARPTKDECLVRVVERAGIELGVPVVCGEAYVGRVTEVWPEAEGGARVRVALVTGARFRVGSEVRVADQGPIFLTVGGVRVPRPGGAPRTVRLAVHQPSSGGLAGGLARVHELFADADESASLAEGFRLGEVRRESEPESALWIEPELDYLDGLFQLAIVVHPEPGAGPPAMAASALDDGRWLSTHALTLRDPAHWRSALKVPLGRSHGIVEGSAVTGAGARLIGRVLHVGGVSSDVALLSDPGFTLGALAHVEGELEPRILGRLKTLAQGEDGRVRMRWWVRVPLQIGAGAGSGTRAGAGSGVGSVRARLFSGSGDPGLPGGLFLGETSLPRSVRAGAVLELVIDPGIDPADIRRLFVRRENRPGQP